MQNVLCPRTKIRPQQRGSGSPVSFIQCIGAVLFPKNILQYEARPLNNPPLDGIKIQNLQILKGTDMYREWSQEAFHIMTMEEYTDLVAEAIALLPEKTVVHRMQGDGPRRLLVAPLWSLDKKRVLNMLTRKTKGLLE